MRHDGVSDPSSHPCDKSSACHRTPPLHRTDKPRLTAGVVGCRYAGDSGGEEPKKNGEDRDLHNKGLKHFQSSVGGG